MPRAASSLAVVAALAAALPAVADGGAPSEIRLLPAGEFRAGDGSGRPEGLPGWRLEEADARRLIAAASARASDYVIDYEHQTLHAASNGKPAPAAGWFKELAWRADGLYAVGVRWTAEAAAMIQAGAYRYLSPVFGYDKADGRVVAIAHAALVNNPGLDGLTDLSALSAALFPPPEKEFAPMKELLKALGLTETATEAEALAALSALRGSHSAELVALKAQAPDPAKYVEVAVLQAATAEANAVKAELATLKAAAHAAEVAGVITEALAAGKLTPATEAWARELGKTNLASLKSYLASASPSIAPGATQTGGKPPAGSGATLSHDELAVCRATGVKPEDYVAAKAA